MTRNGRACRLLVAGGWTAMAAPVARSILRRLGGSDQIYAWRVHRATPGGATRNRGARGRVAAASGFQAATAQNRAPPRRTRARDHVLPLPEVLDRVAHGTGGVAGAGRRSVRYSPSITWSKSSSSAGSSSLSSSVNLPPTSTN